MYMEHIRVTNRNLAGMLLHIMQVQLLNQMSQILAAFYEEGANIIRK